MPGLDVSKLIGDDTKGFCSIPSVNPALATFTTDLAAQYTLYAADCVTGGPDQVTIPVITAAAPQLTAAAGQALMFSAINGLIPDPMPPTGYTPQQTAAAFAAGLQAFWVGCTFGPAPIPAIVVLPPTELLVVLPKTAAVQAATNSIGKGISNIGTDLGKLPSVLASAAVGAPGPAIIAAQNSLNADITTITTKLPDITTQLGNIPSPVLKTSNFPAIGTALGKIPADISACVTALGNIVTTITDFPSTLGADIGAAVVKGLTPITDDIGKQFTDMGNAVVSAVGSLAAPTPQKAEIADVLELAFFGADPFPTQFTDAMTTLAKIFHACTSSGTTSGIDSTIPTAPKPFTSTLGTMADITTPLDLT